MILGISKVNWMGFSQYLIINYFFWGSDFQCLINIMIIKLYFHTTPIGRIRDLFTSYKLQVLAQIWICKFQIYVNGFCQYVIINYNFFEGVSCQCSFQWISSCIFIGIFFFHRNAFNIYWFCWWYHAHISKVEYWNVHH